MLTFQFTVQSKALFGQSGVTVMLPYVNEMGAFGKPNWWENTHIEKFPVLWCMHGGGGSYQDYMQLSNVGRYAEERGLAVVCPDAGDSFYCDVPNGAQQYTYLTQELPAILRMYFPLSDKREDNFIVGLSQGGYGAAKIAFNNPDKFAAVGLMSTGPQDCIQHASRLPAESNKRFDRIFAGGLDSIPGTIDDIFNVLKTAKENGTELPKIFDCCGTEDHIYPAFENFKKFAAEIGLDVHFDEGPGAHTWTFWDEWLQKIIAWLPVEQHNNIRGIRI